MLNQPRCLHSRCSVAGSRAPWSHAFSKPLGAHHGWLCGCTCGGACVSVARTWWPCGRAAHAPAIGATAWILGTPCSQTFVGCDAVVACQRNTHAREAQALVRPMRAVHPGEQGAVKRGRRFSAARIFCGVDRRRTTVKGYPNLKIDLHVRIPTSLHQGFPWLRPIQA